MSKKHHTIELEGLQEWINETTVTYASSTRENKRLICDLKGTFILIVNNTVRWKGMQASRAMEEYNSITEKWVNPLKDFKI